MPPKCLIPISTSDIDSALNFNFFERFEFFQLKNKKVRLFICHFDVKSYMPNLFSFFGIKFPSRIQKSSRKRQAEYFAGRFAAFIVLKSLGVHKKSIKIDENFAPIWEDNIKGSISHNRSIALCLISLEPEHQYLGIDIEEVVDHQTYQQIEHKIIFTRTEYEIVKTSTQPEKAFTIIFSAKESLFKSIYPFIKTKKIGFETSSAIKIHKNYLQIELDLPQKESNKINMSHISSYFWSYGNNIITAVLA